MYKTKLQELCHQKIWNLPSYDTTKEGPDHDPRFRVTVTVNGLSFHSQSPFRSSKHAQNDAAKVAFDHFSTGGSSLPSSPPVVNTDLNENLSSGRTLPLSVQETNQNTQRNEPAANQIRQKNEPAAIFKVDDKFTDVQRLFKNQLQSFAQKRGLTLPVYSCECLGPPHASRFKAKVTIDEKTYESQEFFPTLSKAENAAAKAALMSLAPDGVEEDESAYKNLLQELAQKECYCLPSYTTAKSGEPHLPTFVSTVEVEGESFTGQEARTKKQAELSAAKVAYTALKQRNSRQSLVTSSLGNSSNSPVATCPGNSSQSDLASCSGNSSQFPVASCLYNPIQSASSLSTPQEGQKVVQLPSSLSDFTAFLEKNVQPILPEQKQQAEEDKAIAEVISCDRPVTSPGPESSPAQKRPSTPSASSVTISAAGIEQPVGTDTPRHNKVIVHPRGTNMAYPPGSTVLSTSDGNWVAVRTPLSN
ncbi:hypothetical protein JCGZ_02690 [Jatropha curcas]|uniref:DRBM domain-containing protein n=1 Tax=Jatropha curcas TaxID=180498 RepID=A0A067L599_JATCU|nr:double-stranded RNA-binding protein 1 [Jatropha curcas]KDP39670.1 hypothetical protein JCGZ_02690 [Jatropha curcas]